MDSTMDLEIDQWLAKNQPGDKTQGNGLSGGSQSRLSTLNENNQPANFDGNTNGAAVFGTDYRWNPRENLWSDIDDSVNAQCLLQPAYGDQQSIPPLAGAQMTSYEDTGVWPGYGQNESFPNEHFDLPLLQPAYRDGQFISPLAGAQMTSNGNAGISQGYRQNESFPNEYFDSLSASHISRPIVPSGCYRQRPLQENHTGHAPLPVLKATNHVPFSTSECCCKCCYTEHLKGTLLGKCTPNASYLAIDAISGNGASLGEEHVPNTTANRSTSLLCHSMANYPHEHGYPGVRNFSTVKTSVDAGSQKGHNHPLENTQHYSDFHACLCGELRAHDMRQLQRSTSENIGGRDIHRKTKPRISSSAKEVLENYYFSLCTKPDAAARKKLSDQTGETPERIKNWFSRARQKARQNKIERGSNGVPDTSR